MSVALRYMQLDDVPQVVAIDRLSFSTPWSAHSYSHEVTDATYSYMVVLDDCRQVPVRGMRGWWRRLGGETDPIDIEHRIIGYGGLWSVGEEAHISTIAVHPQQRGNRWGEALLLAMLLRSAHLGAGHVILEVRVSNQPAKNLYYKYDFAFNRRKPGYYRDNNEDAEELKVTLYDPLRVARFRRAHNDLMRRNDYTDLYTRNPRPR